MNIIQKSMALIKRTIEKRTKITKPTDEYLTPAADAWEWSERYRYYQNKKVNYHNSRLEPWIPILQDKSLNRTIIKARKVVASEQFFNIAVHALQKDPWINIAYAMPTEKNHAQPFSKERMNPAINDSPYLKACCQSNSVHAKAFKFFEETVQFLRIDGVVSNDGYPGDKFRGGVFGGTIYDEVQLIPEEAHGVIDAAKKPDRDDYFKICGGTPTTPGNYLNSVLWEKSDQKLFLMKCPSCGLWQHPTIKNVWYHDIDSRGELHPDFFYPLDIYNDAKNAYLACERRDCRASLEPLRGYLTPQSQWQAQKIDVKTYSSGYYVSKFILGLMALPVILADLEKPEYTKRQKFNEIIGLPFAGEDSPFSTDAMKSSLLINVSFRDIDPDSFDFLVATVDWGKPSWYAIHGGSYLDSGRAILILVDIGHTPYEMDERVHGKWLRRRLKQKWSNIDVLIYDEGYSTGRGRDFVDAKDESEKFNERIVFAISSATGPTVKQDFSKIQKNLNVKDVRKTHLIKLPRNWLLENFEDALDPIHTAWFVPWNDQEKNFDGMPIRAYVAHCANVYREPTVDFRDKGRKVYQEIKQEGTTYYKDTGSPDHSLMLFSYASILLIDIVRRLLLPVNKRMKKRQRDEEDDN